MWDLSPPVSESHHTTPSCAANCHASPCLASTAQHSTRQYVPYNTVNLHCYHIPGHLHAVSSKVDQGAHTYTNTSLTSTIFFLLSVLVGSVKALWSVSIMTMLEEVGCTLNFRGVYMRVVETCSGRYRRRHSVHATMAQKQSVLIHTVHVLSDEDLSGQSVLLHTFLILCYESCSNITLRQVVLP